MSTPLEILRQYWHYDSFRPQQEQVVNSVLQGKDTLVLLPTGGGKSICYQVPAMMQEGVCIVISPLIALMKDQVTQLKKRGVPAACLVSGMDQREMGVVLNQCVYGPIKLLYISPERLRSKLFLGHLHQMKVSLIAVDEAHCISQWGYDFRPAYLEISNIRTALPHTPVLALTATATPSVVVDICKQLKFRNQQVFRTSFYRENLAYMVVHEPNKRERLLRIIERVGGSGIVYVRDRKSTYQLAEFLSRNGIQAEFYHAGLNVKDRDVKQRTWTRSRQCVMVATNAFGMGIDKPDVRFVVHMHVPSSVESYFQEAGRAGRDGEKAFAVLLYNERDKEELELHLQRSFPPLSDIRNIYKAISNHYSIPVGGGEDQQFPIDVEHFCRSFGFDIFTFYMAVKFLEREGLLSVSEMPEAISQLYIPMEKRELYRFQIENGRFGDLLQVIIRTYGGIFTNYVNISERELARICHTSVESIETILLKLDKMNVVYYKKKSDRPMVQFLTPRIDTQSLTLHPDNYQRVKDSVMERKNQMLQYIDTHDICRSTLLASYFGETGLEPCGKCDVCIPKYKANQNPSDTQSAIDQRVRDVLLKQPSSIKHILMQCDDLQREEVESRIRQLIDNGTIQVSSSFQLSWIGK